MNFVLEQEFESGRPDIINYKFKILMYIIWGKG